MQSLLIPLAVAIFWLLSCPEPALAYLDPGTGSFIFQLVIGSALAGLTAVKLFWSRIVEKFKPKAETSSRDES